MKHSVPLRQSLLSLMFFLIFFAGGHSGHAQSISNTPSLPELVFLNHSLVSGHDGKDGAVYRFPNVAPGMDALVTLVRRSEPALKLASIDVSGSGWNKALQPQLGLNGNVNPWKTWWMEFEMVFVDAGTSNRRRIRDFNVTSIDMDGDGLSIREFVQMNKVSEVARAPYTLLTDEASLSLPFLSTDDTCSYNLQGTDKKITGPLQNFGDIDTAALSVMATFHYQDKDVIKFILGGKTGAFHSNAGLRLHSLWFRSFSLVPTSTLPVRLSAFQTVFDGRNVTASWSSSMEQDLSHYILERSANGKEFSEVALVFNAGNTLEKRQYTYKDRDVTSSTGILYYRLKMVDDDQSVSYSDTRLVHLGQKDAQARILLFPNPAKSSVHLTLPAAWQGRKVGIEVVSTAGMVVNRYELASASQTELLKLDRLHPGMYQVRARCGGSISVQNLVIQ